VDLSAGMLEKAKHNAEHMGLEVDFFTGTQKTCLLRTILSTWVVNKFPLWPLPQPSCAVREWKRVLKPGGRLLAIDGDWFDPRPSKLFKRLVSEWTERFVKKSRNSLIFRNHYGPIKNSLPLFEEISPINASLLFSEIGFVNIEVDPLLEVHMYKKIGSPSCRNF
jgi:ubiquinone/menaquinone biosynthesis C-methylase UbiE